MKNIFYIIALLVIAAAAFFSFTFKGKFEEQQQVRLSTIADNETVSANADATEEEKNNEIKIRDSKLEEKSLVEAEIDNLKAKERQFRRQLGELEATLEGQNEELAQLQEALDGAKKALEELGIDGDVSAESIAGIISDLEDQEKELTAEIEELDTAIESAENQLSDNRAEIARLASRKAQRDTRIRRNAMQSVVTAVDQDWGFVVIGAGSRTGFTPQTRLIIQRNGRRIAEVKPSSIEATQTIAEIDMDTLAPGVRIQPGDRVLLGKLATN